MYLIHLRIKFVQSEQFFLFPTGRTKEGRSMKKTFATIMPDKIGSFLKADKCIENLGLNITRVSYNKSLDAHMLFIEVEGKEDKLNLLEKELTDLGYIKNLNTKNIILMEFRLEDKPGALLPILELIDNYKFNISYISSKENGSGFQDFKMGLLIENEKEVYDFISHAVKLCPVRILDYNSSEKNLDNTVFYISFVNEISKKMGLNEEQKRELLINSNQIMQNLDEKNLPPYKTFDYIGRFSDFLLKYKGEFYNPRVSEIKISDNEYLLIVEPPCGSNICVFVTCDTLIFVDSGFSLYKDELLKLLRERIKDFDKLSKELLLTHSDVDHIGFLDFFDKVWMSKNSRLNLYNVWQGKSGYREQIDDHSPYVKISKILSGYKPTDCSNFYVIGEKNNSELMEYIGSVKIGDYTFETYEGKGGHTSGETVFIERNLRIVFSGDLFINIHDCVKEQKEFNKIAPYLMTSVDCDPLLASMIRKRIKPLLEKGKWTVIGGHGAPCEWNVCD